MFWTVRASRVSVLLPCRGLSPGRLAAFGFDLAVAVGELSFLRGGPAQRNRDATQYRQSRLSGS